MSDDKVLLKHSRMPRKVQTPEAQDQADPTPTDPSPQTASPSQQISRQHGGHNIKLPHSHLKTCLARYINGEHSYDIAKSYGITPEALYTRILNSFEDQWIKAQVARAMARKDKAQEQLDAESPLALACARESLKSAQWDLERLYRKRFGQDVDAKPSQPPIFAVYVIKNNDLPETVVIEHEKPKDLT